MKKKYVKPEIRFESYTLSESIASNCAIVVSNGPAMGGHEQCDDYDDPFAMSNEAMTASLYNVQFYEDTNCDCYYSSSDTGYWMS